MKLFRQRKPNRMPKYDYSSRGCYFVTICVQNKDEGILGKIVDGKTILSNIGEIIKKYWLEIPSHFPWIRLDEFIIMPNHIHGILVIQHDVGNANLRSLHNPIRFKQEIPIRSERFPSDRTKMLLCKVIQNFKAAVTREINKCPTSDFFIWQKSFYDHIIHNYKELLQIRQYIKENPNNWRKNNKEFDNIFK
jgi:putative transposase